MDINSPAAGAASRILLPAIGTSAPHLGGVFSGIVRGKPGTNQPDYALIVSGDAASEHVCTWGGYGQDRPDAACMWDGAANTAALVARGDHPAAAFCHKLNLGGYNDWYLPSLRELKALFANGCELFDAGAWYWSSTQFSRNYAFNQYFGYGGTLIDGKDWQGGRARAVRRALLESLNP